MDVGKLLPPRLRSSLKLLFDGSTVIGGGTCGCLANSSHRQQPPNTDTDCVVVCKPECTQASEPLGIKPLGPIPELIVEGLDSESIWQELQLRDLPLLKWARGTTAVLTSNGGSGFEVLTSQAARAIASKAEDSEDEENVSGSEGSDDSGADDVSDDSNPAASDNGEDSASNDELALEDEHDALVESYGDSDGDDGFDDDAEENDGEVDEEGSEDEPVGTDGFFRWNDMEGFVDELERAQELVRQRVY